MKLDKSCESVLSLRLLNSTQLHNVNIVKFEPTISSNERKTKFMLSLTVKLLKNVKQKYS